MRLGILRLENRQKRAQIRAKEVFEKVRGILRKHHPLRSNTLPVIRRGLQPAFHSRQTATQIRLLPGKRSLKNALKNLFVAKFQRLLNGSVRIQRSKPLVV